MTDDELDALAHAYKQSHITRDVWPEDKCFRDGYLAAVAHLTPEIEKLVAALEFYAHKDSWRFIDTCSETKDVIASADLSTAGKMFPFGGKIARAALAEWHKYKGEG